MNDKAPVVRTINVRQLENGTWQATVFSLNEQTKYFEASSEFKLYVALADATVKQAS